MLQMLLGVFFLSDLGQKIYRATSPSTEYKEYTEYQLFFPTCAQAKTKSEAGLFLLWLYPKVCAHLLRSLCIVKGGKQCGSSPDCLDRGSENKKGMEMFLFTCRNVSIAAGQCPGQCLDKTKQWKPVLGGESPWLCSPILEASRNLKTPNYRSGELWSKFFQKIPKELSVLVWIRCLLCISQSRYFTFYFSLFWGLNSSDVQSELKL